MSDAQAKQTQVVDPFGQSNVNRTMEDPTGEPALDRINHEIVGLIEREQQVIERLTMLRNRLFGETLETAKNDSKKDPGPGKIGSINGCSFETHHLMTAIENLVEELSHL